MQTSENEMNVDINASNRSRAQFRKAQLQAKRNDEAAKRKERERLFAGVQEGSRSTTGRRKGQDKLSQDDLVLNASSDVTAALRRTHQLMQSELQRSQFAHQTLRVCTSLYLTSHSAYLKGRTIDRRSQFTQRILRNP